MIAPHPEKGGVQERGYTKGFFKYDKENDCYSRLTSTSSTELRGCFSQFKADNAGGLTPGKADNAEMRKTDRKTVIDFEVNRLYICPHGSILARPKQRHPNRKRMEYYNKAACATCEHKDKCIPRVKHRLITRKEFDSYMDDVDAYTQENRALYSK